MKVNLTSLKYPWCYYKHNFLRPFRNILLAFANFTYFNCNRLFSSSFLCIHHIDHNIQNNNLTNLMVLCKFCHSKNPNFPLIKNMVVAI